MIEIDQNEQILRTVRRHWVALLVNGFTLLMITLAPIIFVGIVSLTPVGDVISFTGIAWEAMGVLLMLWLTIIWMLGWYMFTDYYLDTLIITNKRIFDIEQYGLFRRRSSAFRLDRIQNVSVNVHGVIQTFLNYGTIRLETAGEKEDFIAPYVSDPYDVKKFISELQDEAMDRPQQVQMYGNKITRIEDGHSSDIPRNDGEAL